MKTQKKLSGIKLVASPIRELGASLSAVIICRAYCPTGTKRAGDQPVESY